MNSQIKNGIFISFKQHKLIKHLQWARHTFFYTEKENIHIHENKFLGYLEERF